jgi:Ca2+-binding RTX toxin-like protein
VGSSLLGDTVDHSAAISSGSVVFSGTNTNLTTGLVTVNGTGAPLPLSFTVQQFENIIGSNYDDAITSNTASNSLAGGGGNDVISGDDITSIANLIFAYNDKYYTLSNAGSWSQAQAQAASLAANLVTVNNAAENQFLVNTFGGTEALWIGFADEATEGVFEWANGEAVAYTNWAPGEPNNAGNEDYAEFNIDGAGKWNDRPDLGGLRRGIIEIDNSADTLVGGLGGDTLTGGLGNDVFKYTSVTESTASETNRDTITDFQLGLDRLDLGAIDANSLIALDQAFSFLGNSATFTNAGQLRYQVSGDNLLLFGNIDANFATSEFELQLSGLASIGASDIIL